MLTERKQNATVVIAWVEAAEGGMPCSGGVEAMQLQRRLFRRSSEAPVTSCSPGAAISGELVGGSAMMATEERVDLEARLRGFKLLRQRGNMSYSLRLIRDASLVLSELPDGRFGFAPLRCGRNREACWLPLSSIALLRVIRSSSGQPYRCAVGDESYKWRRWPSG
jgi:hypothetical protein